MDSDSEPELKLISLFSQLASLQDPDPDPEVIPVITQIISLVSSMDLDSQPKPESELMSCITQSISLFKSIDLDSQPEPLRKIIFFISQKLYLLNSTDHSGSEQNLVQDSEFMSLVRQTLDLKPEPELMSVINQIISLSNSMDSEQNSVQDLEFLTLVGQTFDLNPEPKLVSLISQLIFLNDSDSGYSSDSTSLITQIISLVNSMDLDSQPNQESELISLIAHTTSLFNSMDFDSLPESLSELISLISQDFSPTNSTHLDSVYKKLVHQTMSLELELISLIHQILSLVISMYSKSAKFISLCPQVQVSFDGKFHVIEEVSCSSNDKWNCLPFRWVKVRLTGEDATHFLCRGCNGENHEEYDKAPVVIKHTLHPKHSLQLVLSQHNGRTRECYCCDEDLNELFYYCSACDLAINLACVEKPPVLSIDHPKWHEHTLTLFPRHTSLTCDLCGLADSSCPFYICSPCGFVVHQKCTRLPRVVRISRHLHRIAFTFSFDQRDWSCGVCHKNIDNDYGGYSCAKEDCLFAAHSQCATRRHVWDGLELEEEEEEEEDVAPFEVVNEETIQHFSHHHHLRLDENTGKHYYENKMCHACNMPIYFGNFYSCMQCEFILHKVCAHLFSIIHHPLHSHWLTLVVRYEGLGTDENKCSACPSLCTSGLFYKCHRELCSFKLHVQCATTTEPLVHKSHKHPLFLTSGPEERTTCHVCKESGHCSTNETFNCIECDFSLCFKCATLPQNMRYTDDKHMLTLSYGEDTSVGTHWCEECERKIDQSVGFYMCDEYSCVALHIECLLGVDLYMMPGSSWLYDGSMVYILLNNRQTSPHICSNCKTRCPHKIVFKYCGFIFCSTFCIRNSVVRGD